MYFIVQSSVWQVIVISVTYLAAETWIYLFIYLYIIMIVYCISLLHEDDSPKVTL